MTTRVFIAGSMHIKHLDKKIKERLDNIVSSKFEVVIGDAGGVDTSIQEYLASSGSEKITVFCSGSRPRNNVGDWPVRSVDTEHPEGSRAYFTAKDLSMAEEADIGLMIWDTKSTGTLSNVLELLQRRKRSVVFINKEKTFMTVSTLEELESLLSYMSDHARRKADEKIKISKRMESLKNDDRQVSLFD